MNYSFAHNLTLILQPHSVYRSFLVTLFSFLSIFLWIQNICYIILLSVIFLHGIFIFSPFLDSNIYLYHYEWMNIKFTLWVYKHIPLDLICSPGIPDSLPAALTVSSCTPRHASLCVWKVPCFPAVRGAPGPSCVHLPTS